jgi:hypothetical protein
MATAAPQAPAAPSAPGLRDSSASPPVSHGREYKCECGHVLSVSGGGRHRVFFELDDEARADPVMNRVCPECGHGLPGKNRP